MARALPLLEAASNGFYPASFLVEYGKIEIPVAKIRNLDFLFAFLRDVRSSDLDIASRASTSLVLSEDYRVPILLFEYATQFRSNPATALATIESLGDLFLFATDKKIKT